MKHLFALVGVIVSLLLSTGCATQPATIARDDAPATQPAGDREELRQQAKDLALTRSILLLKNTRLKDDIAKFQAELNKEGVSTSGGTSARDVELRSIIEQLQQARSNLDDAKARLSVLNQAAERGEFTSDIDAEIEAHPASSKEAEAERRIQRREALKKKLNEQIQIAQFKLKSIQERAEEMKSIAGEIDYKLFLYFQAKADQEVIAEQLRDIERRMQSIEEATRVASR